MLDRFYFANETALNETALATSQPPPPMQSWNTVPVPSPGVPIQAPGQPLPLPLPPVSSLPLEPEFQPTPATPVPPAVDVSATSNATGGPIDYETMASSPTSFGQGQYKLLGVVQTNSFGAALFETATNSYSVQIGEQIGHSPYVLSGLEDGKAILRNGEQTLVLHVGEAI
jgi:hypothetical protein